jgi:hypothetical protein
VHKLIRRIRLPAGSAALGPDPYEFSTLLSFSNRADAPTNVRRTELGI